MKPGQVCWAQPSAALCVAHHVGPQTGRRHRGLLGSAPCSLVCSSLWDRRLAVVTQACWAQSPAASCVAHCGDRRLAVITQACWAQSPAASCVAHCGDRRLACWAQPSAASCVAHPVGPQTGRRHRGLLGSAPCSPVCSSPCGTADWPSSHSASAAAVSGACPSDETGQHSRMVTVAKQESVARTSVLDPGDLV